eukprot:scaffold161490_cov33-Prasinocladus_malaysianus.AAC.11
MAVTVITHCRGPVSMNCRAVFESWQAELEAWQVTSRASVCGRPMLTAPLGRADRDNTKLRVGADQTERRPDLNDNLKVAGNLLVIDNDQVEHLLGIPVVCVELQEVLGDKNPHGAWRDGGKDLDHSINRREKPHAHACRLSLVQLSIQRHLQARFDHWGGGGRRRVHRPSRAWC